VQWPEAVLRAATLVGTGAGSGVEPKRVGGRGEDGKGANCKGTEVSKV
jgi:hypothetical protein